MFITSPPTGNNRYSRLLVKTASSLLPASSNHRLRSRPCPCKSSCLCNHCRRICSRPCPYKNFGLYRRAFPSPFCRTSSLCPERQRKPSPRGADSKPGYWRWFPRASPRQPHRLVESDSTWSFPQRPPQFGLNYIPSGKCPCPKTVYRTRRNDRDVTITSAWFGQDRGHVESTGVQHTPNWPRPASETFWGTL